MIGFDIYNQGAEELNIISAFMHNSSGFLAVQSNGSQAIYSGTPLIVLRSGATSPIFNTTVIDDGGNYTLKVLTDKGNTATGLYPPPPIGVHSIEGLQEAVEGLTTAAIGDILMNFTSIEVCTPAVEACEPISNDWFRGWEVPSDPSNGKFFRISLRYLGDSTIFLSKDTVLGIIGPFSAASLSANNFYIKDPPTFLDDDGLPYSNFGIALTKGSIVTLYFGSTGPAIDDLTKLTNDGMYMVILTVFAYVDMNGNGIYEPGIDTAPYGQSLPFQGLLVS
ncbi:MAG: hypothetical protein ACE1ZC_01530 [Nitrososphaerales archaeon]